MTHEGQFHTECVFLTLVCVFFRLIWVHTLSAFLFLASGYNLEQACPKSGPLAKCSQRAHKSIVCDLSTVQELCVEFLDCDWLKMRAAGGNWTFLVLKH